MYRIAYLCCEIKHRDLESRLLIAAYLLKMGIPVVVGQVWAQVALAQHKINVPGCYLFGTTNKFQANGMHQVKSGGHMVVASDEEILPVSDPIPYVDKRSIAVCDKFLVDTEEHLGAFCNAYPESADKFLYTGAVRLESLTTKKYEEVEESPYILVNTGLGVINSKRGNPQEAIKIISTAWDIPKEEGAARLRVGQAAFDLMVPLIKWLSASQAVVVRPHPNERVQTWIDAVPEARVIEESSPYPWIKGAKIVIHNNSTTGLEAAALGVAALNLDPIPEYGDRYILRRVNHTVNTLDEAKSALSAFLEDGAGPIADRVSKGIDFSLEGAKNMAREISLILRDKPLITGEFPWARVTRDKLSREKFTVSIEEVQAIMNSYGFHGPMKELDDSLFLFAPE